MPLSKRTAAMAAMLLLLPAAAGCTSTEEADDPAEATAEAGDASLAETLDDLDGAGQAAGLFEQAGLERMLEGEPAYTIFVPSDEAIAALPEADRQRLSTEEGRPELIALLRRHISPGAIAAQDLDVALNSNDNRVELASMAEEPIVVIRQGDSLRLVNGDTGPNLAGTAVSASNGVIYLIDAIMAPDG